MTLAVAGVDAAELEDPALRLSDEDLAWLDQLGRLEGSLVGSTEPRIWTRPLRDLDDPDASLGYDVIGFATDVLGVTLLPWQRWWLIHALELNQDGSLRFGRIVTLIARQNGKTFLITVLALYWLFIKGARLILGTAQKVETAKESWSNAYDLAAEQDVLASEFLHNQRGKPGRWEGSGSTEIRLTGGRRYRVSASTPGAARGLTVDLLIMDEIRQQKDDKAWAALSKTTGAVYDSLIVAISNAGEEDSVVLNRLRAAAISGKLSTIAIFEWSAPDGCALTDLAGWQAANPSMGYFRKIRDIALDLITDEPGTFRTECLCQRVTALDTLFDPPSWEACKDVRMTLDADRTRVVLCLDVAPDAAHATLVAAAKAPNGRIKLDVVKSWGLEQMPHLVNDVNELVSRIRPRKFGWFPGGPAAAFGSSMRRVRRHEEITDVAGACQGLVALVRGQQVEHGADPLLTRHILEARKYPMGDGYRYTRRAGHVDAAYAAAGAAHLAQSLRSGGMVVV